MSMAGSVAAMPEFTGEQFIPGKAGARIAADHLARYRFARSFAAGRRVLDIACGVGYGTAILADGGATFVDGVDHAEPIISAARSFYPRCNVKYTTGDIATYATTEPYDLVTCFETIEHVNDHEAGLSNHNRLIRPGGVLLISSPNRLLTSPDAKLLSDTPRNRFHVREFTPNELVLALQRAGFTVPSGGLYGQRQQRAISGRRLRVIYGTVFMTKYLTSAAVTPLSRRMPRYVVIRAIAPRERNR